MVFIDSVTIYLIVGTFLGFILGILLQQFKIRDLEYQIKNEIFTKGEESK